MSKTPPEPKDGYPMRINKYLAHEGVATRRAADELIAKGRVLINKKIAKLGDKVILSDTVELVGTMTPKRFLYYAYNKPVGVITHSPQLGEKDIKQSVTKGKGKSEMNDVFPVGRLDKDSSGLIILTNDGRVTDRLLNPDYDHDKEYRCTASHCAKAESDGRRVNIGAT
jgi:16S rRNA U516 pseudouridylate synthase RsuA-like enzyme